MKNSVRRWRFIGYKRFVDDTGTPHEFRPYSCAESAEAGEWRDGEPSAMANHIEGIDSPDSPQFANFDHG